MSIKNHGVTPLGSLDEAGITLAPSDATGMAAVAGDKASKEKVVEPQVRSSGAPRGKSSLRVPEEFEAGFAGMGAIVLKCGEAGQTAKQMVDILYKAIFKLPRTKMHPLWTANSNGKNHIVFVHDEDIASLQAMYGTDQFQDGRRQWEKLNKRRAPRLSFHRHAEIFSSDNAQPRVASKQESRSDSSMSASRSPWQ